MELVAGYKFYKFNEQIIIVIFIIIISLTKFVYVYISIHDTNSSVPQQVNKLTWWLWTLISIH